MHLVEDIFQEISSSLIVESNPSKIAGMEAYMRNKFSFLGISSVNRKAIVKTLNLNPLFINSDILIPLVEKLWQQPHREYQYLAIDLLIKYRKLLQTEHIPSIITLIEKKSWWDTVDMLAASVLGDILNRNPKTNESIIETLSASNNFWLNRTAIIYQLKFKEKTNVALLEMSILPHLESNEFFIQKSIGWALRQYSKTNPIYVIDFVNKHSLKPLSKKEALKHIVSKS
jgi:3-methyladenine DNA glycosylase AlkD